MSKIFLFVILLLSTGLMSAQEISCRYGFGFEISNSPHWGKNKPVITGVNPGSPAEKAGLKQYDIIMAVEGVQVTDSILDDIYLFINPEGKDIVRMTIKNFDGEQRKVSVKKECRSMYSISEEQLATAFAMYAVEYTHERLFSCPFVTKQTADELDFATFKTFDFADSDANQPELAKKINDIIKKTLTDRKLRHTTVNPDFLIRISYSFNKNSNYKPRPTTKSSNDNKAPDYSVRYDINRDRMVLYPFLPPETLETEAEYILKLGIKFEDCKIKSGRVIWECEANEMLNEIYSLGDYAFVNIPLMLKQFPYTKYGRNVQFRLSKKKYNYTGINYNIDNMAVIASVDKFSPADRAGLKPADHIDAIQNRRTDYTSQEFTNAYRRFLFKTLKLRDQSTRFVDARGFPDCMFWDDTKYKQVADAFSKPKNMTAFAYLFQYAQFINPFGNNSCSFKIQRGDEKLEYIIRPEIRSELVLMVE
ncbi:MAG: PDZ domain-containing protein [Tannerella sp.]|jgi:hypothetical protein|nr:PDZ domain-containing protein [Tannerella sp.]